MIYAARWFANSEKHFALEFWVTQKLLRNTKDMKHVYQYEEIDRSFKTEHLSKFLIGIVLTETNRKL